jgi:hypothetical protein
MFSSLNPSVSSLQHLAAILSAPLVLLLFQCHPIPSHFFHTQ